MFQSIPFANITVWRLTRPELAVNVSSYDLSMLSASNMTTNLKQTSFKMRYWSSKLSKHVIKHENIFG